MMCMSVLQTLKTQRKRQSSLKQQIAEGAALKGYCMLSRSRKVVYHVKQHIKLSFELAMLVTIMVSSPNEPTEI